MCIIVDNNNNNNNQMCAYDMLHERKTGIWDLSRISFLSIYIVYFDNKRCAILKHTSRNQNIGNKKSL